MNLCFYYVENSIAFHNNDLENELRKKKKKRKTKKTAAFIKTFATSCVVLDIDVEI